MLYTVYNVVILCVVRDLVTSRAYDVSKSGHEPPVRFSGRRCDMIVIIIFLSILFNFVNSQDLQRNALCDMQMLLTVPPTLNGWNNTCVPGSNDTDIHLQNWEGVVWVQLNASFWAVTEMYFFDCIKFLSFLFLYLLFELIRFQKYEVVFLWRTDLNPYREFAKSDIPSA